MAITALPSLDRTSATFRDDLDDFFLTDLPTFSTEAEAARVAIVASETAASTYATTATTQAGLAAASATQAAGSATAAGATIWVSGTSYVVGNTRFSPIDAQTYRRITNGAGTTDPSADPTNWTRVLLNNSALILLATVTPTAAANIDFLTTFSSLYNNYLIIGDGIKMAADDGVSLRLAVAGAADTGSNYYNSAVTSSIAVNTAATVRSAGTGTSFMIQVLNANTAATVKSVLATATWNSTVAGPVYTDSDIGASYFAASIVSGFRLFGALGSNFSAAGKILVYGYTNS